MSLRDEIETYLALYTSLDGAEDLTNDMIALVKAHMTSDEAVERARRQLSFHPSVRAAILAALGKGE